MKKELEIFTDHILKGARASNQRPGQYLYNHLPNGAAAAVNGTLFDPFHKDLDRDGIYEWLDNHIITHHGWIIAVFNNNQILWEQYPLELNYLLASTSMKGTT